MSGLSQRELASQSGVAHRTLADFETGTRQPNHRTAGAIKEALELQGVTFLKDDGEFGPGVRYKPPKQGGRFTNG